MPRGRERPSCTIEGCDNKNLCHGLCGMHWARFKKRGSTDPSGLLFGKRPKTFCPIRGCTRQVASNGMCSVHYRRQARNGHSELMEPKPKKDFLNNGYLYRYLGHGKNRAVHRIIMESQIGRPLFFNETIHHKNGIKADNRLENLELWVKWQPTGCRVSDLIMFAKEVLIRYGNVT